MKRIKIFLSTALSAAAMLVGNPFTATAQQLPNNGFEEGWVDCVPWTSSGNTETKGKTPTSWTISHVIGIGGTGATEVGQQISGHNSSNGVRVINSPNSTMSSQKVPGYITLGTTWSTSVMGKKNDGGSYGGTVFSHRPDAMSFYYKRGRGTHKPDEITTIVAYAWKGEWQQASVPSEIKAFGSPKTITMIDRERNVIGYSLDGCLGGSVTKSSDAELISLINLTITDNSDDWINSYTEFEYKSNSVPTKFNVIFAAGDYFGGSSVVGEGNYLDIDDVKLVYYSRLASLKVKGLDVDGFDSNKYEYSLNVDELPTAADISVTFMGNSGSGVANIAVANRSASEAVATITVTNKNGSSAGFEDIDGKTSHTYSITFKRTLKIDLLSLIVNNEKISGPWEPTSTISTKQPFTGEIVAVLSGNIETPPTLGDREGSNDRPTRTMTVTHPEDNSVKTSYTLEFLPYIAEIEHVDMERGNSLSPNENGEIAVGQRYSVAGGVKNVTLKKSSGNPTYTCSEVKDVDIAPKIEITVVNDDADPKISRTYTVVYNPPVSSRISGVVIGGTTYPVNTEDNTIDLTSLMPLPDINAIEPVYILPDDYQSSEISIDTENSTGSITVTNSQADKDYDKLSSHTYTLKLAPVSVSRPRNISLRNTEGNMVEWSPEFDSKHYEYKLRSFMPADNAFEYEWFGSALTVSAERIGDAYSETPQIRLKFTGTDGGKDFDGETSHTYTLSFNKMTDDFRSNHLSEIRIAGTPLENFDKSVLNYNIATPVVNESDISWKIFEDEFNSSDGTTVTVTRDENKAVITLLVKNDIANSSGQSERTYTLQFLPYYSRLAAVTAPDGSSVNTLGLVATDGKVPMRLLWQIPKLPDTERDIDASLVFMNPTAGTTVHTVTADADEATATVTVSNEKPDADGLSTHTYILTYDRPYYSRLQSIMVNGTEIEGFDRNKFDYIVDGQMPGGANAEVLYQFIQNSNNLGDYKIANQTIDAEAAKITVVVSNSEPDVDGLSTHTYTVQYSLPYFSRIESLKVGGTIIADVPQDGATPMAVAMQLPADDEAAKALFAATFRECSGTPTIEYAFDRANGIATLKVTNSGEKDPDGAAVHIYLVQFEPPYSSAAESITIDGVAVNGFSSGTTEYTVGGPMPSTDAVAVVYAPGSGICSHEISSDVETATITVTVTNSGDGSGNYISSTTYTLHFDLPYFSRLSSLKIRGAEIEGFDKNRFEYTIAGVAPARNEIEATVMPCSGNASAQVSIDVEQGLVTVSVTNISGTDLDGKDTHVYTLHFDKPVNSRLASIIINGTPLAGFAPDTYIYNIESSEMPEDGAVSYTLGGDAATATVSYDRDNAEVTIVVSAEGADIDGLNQHKYVLRFKKPAETPSPGGVTSVYEGTLTIMMMGEDITGGGQAAKVEITEESDGICTFLLPDFSLDLGDGPAPLGDIKVENVAMTPDGKGGYTYSGVVNGLELADGAIVADVTLTGTTDADGNASMTIAVLWEGIAIDVEFNGECTSTILPPAPPAEGEWSEFDGTLSIEMMGSYIAEGQPATVLITEPVDGKCDFKLPDFSLDLDGSLLNLGDIEVNGVEVSEQNGLTTYKGFVAGMAFLEGEIIADINLDGSVDASGNAVMTIQVLWKQDGDDIPINVVFNGKRNEIEWMTVAGKLTIAMEGYDITEGGSDATIRIAKTGDDGLYTFLLPDFSLALDAASEPAKLGDIRIDNVTMTPCNGYDRYTGRIEGMSLADGEIVADIKVDGTITSDNNVRVNVDVVWIMEDGKRVPILVKFTNMADTPVEPVKTAYSGILKTQSDGNETEHSVTVFITPGYGNRVDIRIEGIDFAAAGRAAMAGNSISVPSVSVTSVGNGLKAYDGAVIGSQVKPGVTLDITLHGFSDRSNNFNIELDMLWVEQNARLSGSFSGTENTSAITDVPASDIDNGVAEEYYDLRGVRVDGTNLRPGIYIRRKGNRSEKILIK